jgi:hypothetical protein
MFITAIWRTCKWPVFINSRVYFRCVWYSEGLIRWLETEILLFISANFKRSMVLKTKHILASLRINWIEIYLCLLKRIAVTDRTTEIPIATARSTPNKITTTTVKKKNMAFGSILCYYSKSVDTFTMNSHF